MYQLDLSEKRTAVETDRDIVAGWELSRAAAELVTDAIVHDRPDNRP